MIVPVLVALLSAFTAAAQYTNTWAVLVEGGAKEANALAADHGYVNEGQVIHLIITADR